MQVPYLVNKPLLLNTALIEEEFKDGTSTGGFARSNINMEMIGALNSNLFKNHLSNNADNNINPF